MKNDTVKNNEPHTFHIPVMGISFSVDTPIRVARYGISSVVSIMDDMLAENLRRHYSQQEGEPYEEIPTDSEDSRARRITEYLNLMGKIVARQVRELQAAPFKKGSEITRYFEMLPDGSWLKRKYTEMLASKDEDERKRLEEELRPLATPGSIDVNIMTKVDKDNYKDGEKLAPEFADAMSCLRGFAKSNLDSAIVFSAGLNPRLYAYAAKFKDFFPGEDGSLMKKIVLKVSDFRSAIIQGKFLAKHGLWVSEYRVESGLNCGGHTFSTNGSLMGPILEEFRKNRQELIDGTFKMLKRGLKSVGIECPEEPFGVKITVQGGIGVHEEDALLRERYGVDGTGWATPFLLVPEAVVVDDEHSQKLIDATVDDVALSKSSPFGIPFWTLRTSASEKLKRERVEAGEPGAPCTRGILKLNPEFPGKPLCSGSKTFIKKKLADIEEGGYNDEQKRVLKADALEKACLCVDLGGAANRKFGFDTEAAPSFCPGPNIAYFDRTYSLEEMVSHIYGRINLIKDKTERPHMFIKELMLSVAHLKEEIERYRLRLSTRNPKYFREFSEGLLKGIEHYYELAEDFIGEKKARFLEDLAHLKKEIEGMSKPEEVLSVESSA